VGKIEKIELNKPIRDIARIEPGDKVLIEAFEGELVIKKI
jgi:hypothetical protein